MSTLSRPRTKFVAPEAALAASSDIGRLAAQLIGEEWEGVRIVELEAARRYDWAWLTDHRTLAGLCKPG